LGRLSPNLAKPQNVVQQLMTNMSQKEEQFEDYFKFIKILGIDTEENYNEIKEYYSKGLLRFNIS
jgi:preprotein translocase subunit Sec63